jgi:LPXTG-motif cell wall-anchored protein
VFATLQILPPGSVRDETTFLILLSGLAVLVGAAIYLRIKRRREEKDEEGKQS